MNAAFDRYHARENRRQAWGRVLQWAIAFTLLIALVTLGGRP